MTHRAHAILYAALTFWFVVLMVAGGLWAEEAFGATWEWSEAAGDPRGYRIEVAMPPCETWWMLADVATPRVTIATETLPCMRVAAFRTDPLEFGPVSETYIPVPEPPAQLLVGLAGLLILARGRWE